MEEEIKRHLSKFDLDVRKTGDARFTDQKCTPDVVCIIADCVLNLRGDNTDIEFTVKDIWDSNYFNKQVKAIFNKPSAKNPTTKSEYDKYIGQPLRLLAYAGVLSMKKLGITNIYTIADSDLVEYIALKDRNAYHFLYLYFVKVLGDSGILKSFEDYKEKYLNGKLKDEDFNFLKHKFQNFLKGNTNINGNTEVNRIFPKILNIYACENNLPGTVKGKMSKHPFSYSDLMYNRPNWRDVNKNKQTSRQEALIEIGDGEANINFDNYLIQKAVSNIKRWHPVSEVNDQWANGEATQVHHIFPSYAFPQLAHYVENLIRLTPTQHNTKAHPNNNTRSISKDYQCVCLISKSQSIETSINTYGERYYKKALFIYVVNKGLEFEHSNSLPSDLSFADIRSQIAHYYNNN